MDRSMYRGVAADWKIDLVVARARRLGFRRHDLEDAVQEVLVDVLAFEYIPERSNGATEQTALTALVDHKLKTIRRGEQRRQAAWERLSPPPESDDGVTVTRLQTMLEVREVVSRLTADEQAICAEAGAGRSLRQIALRRGWTWRQIERAWRRIRQRFLAAGWRDDDSAHEDVAAASIGSRVCDQAAVA